MFHDAAIVFHDGPVLEFDPIKLIPKTIGNRKRDCA